MHNPLIEIKIIYWGRSDELRIVDEDRIIVDSRSSR
jgi:hypothetical protein